MKAFGIEPKCGSLAEAYFTGKECCHTYSDTYSLPAGITVDFIVRCLIGSSLTVQSPFRSMMTYVRLLRQLEGKMPVGLTDCYTLKIGTEFGCMCIIDRSPTEILLLENYSTPNFFVSFMIDQVERNKYQLAISMNVLIKGRLNKFYFTICQPIQHRLASYVLKLSFQRP